MQGFHCWNKSGKYGSQKVSEYSWSMSKDGEVQYERQEELDQEGRLWKEAQILF